MSKPKKLPNNYTPTDTTFVKQLYPWFSRDIGDNAIRTIPNDSQWAQIAMNPYFLKMNVPQFTTPDEKFKAAGILRDNLYNTNNLPYVRYIDSLMYNNDTSGVNNLINGFNQSPTSIPSNFMSNYTKQFASGGLSRAKDYGSSKKPYPMVKSKDFAGPNRSYPIPTKADAIDALRLAGLHNRPDIRDKVYAKYPGLKKHGKGGVIDEYSLGGWIKDNWHGVLGGLETAAGVAGLIGTLGLSAPLSAGLITGGLSAVGKELSQDEAAKQQSELMNQQQELMKQQENNSPTSYSNSFAPTFATGGLTPGVMPNAQLEKKEVGELPNGAMFQVNGPTHKQGGVDLSLPQGTVIWSDRDKASNGKTFAENAAKYKRMKDAALKKLADKPKNKVTKDSLMLTVQHAEEELRKLFTEQEMNKPKNKQQNKYPFGGITNLTNQAFDYANSIPSQMSPYLGTSGFDPYQLATSTVSNNLPLVSATTTGPGEGFGNLLYKTNWGNVGNTLMSLAPVAFNTAMSFRQPKLLNANDIYNTNAGKIESLLGNRHYNINPLLQANIAGENAANRNLSSVATSSGQLFSNLIGSSAAKMRADANAYAQKNNVENQYKNQLASMLYGLGRDRSLVDLQSQMYNLGAENNRYNYLGAATSQLSQYAQRNALMNNQKLRDEQFLQMLPDMFGNMMKFLPYLQNLKIA